mgnify:FL=1
MGKKEEVLTEYGIIIWDRSKPQEEQWEMAPKWPDKYEEKHNVLFKADKPDEPVCGLKVMLCGRPHWGASS